MEHYKSLVKSDYFLAGCISGLFGRVAVQPLDVIKIRFQLQVEPIGRHLIKAGKYSGLVQSIRCILKEEGVSAFWKGHIPAQAQAISFTAAQFFSFEIIFKQLTKYYDNEPDNEGPRIRPSANFIAGCLAGACAAIMTQPLDVLRTRFIAQGADRVYNNIIHGSMAIARKQGIRGFFLGLSPTLILIAPQTGLQFGFYGLFTSSLHHFINKDIPMNSSNISPLNGVQTLICGSFAGSLAKMVVYPLDVAKKRMQVQGFEEARSKFGKIHVSKGLRECLLKTIKEEGPFALFKGLKPSILKSCISVGVRFSVYDQICLFINNYRSSKSSKQCIRAES